MSVIRPTVWDGTRGPGMKVRVVDDMDQTIWERGEEKGTACRRYIRDGTQLIIIEALSEALDQAKNELRCLDDSHRVPDIGRPPT